MHLFSCLLLLYIFHATHISFFLYTSPCAFCCFYYVGIKIAFGHREFDEAGIFAFLRSLTVVSQMTRQICFERYLAMVSSHYQHAR